MGLGDLAHDREPEAGARKATRRGRAIEAIEDVRQVLVGDARPVVADLDGSAGHPYLDPLAVGAPLDGVVEEVRHGAV